MIFVDTGAFIARYLESDEHHAAAIAGFKRLERGRTPILTTCHVLDETITLLGRWAGNRFAAARGRAILASESLEIARPTVQQELAALDRFAKFADQKMSFTDCLSFVVMAERSIRDAFGFDRHFRLAGFRLWPDSDL